jgi:L-rhamnose isomerase / sugar isomerase
MSCPAGKGSDDMAGTTAIDASSSSLMDRLLWAVDDLEIELPSWGFVNTGTRFRVWPQAGVPRNVEEKVDDAGTVRRYTGIAKSVALHIPWDRVDDYAVLGDHIESRGLRVGAINSNTFQGEDYMLGSLCHPSPEVRAKAVAATIECCRIAAAMEAPAVKVWLGDGTNYPGQDDLRHRRHRLVEGLQQVYAELPEHARMYLEYKIFEPAVYSTDVQDWGQALSVCRHVGERAVVCVDTGHHSLGVNIEQIVALLLAEGRLGSFDLNDKKYGDDDLMVAAIDPYQLFRITHELINAMRDDSDVVGQRTARETAYMLDQCHNIEPKVPAMIRSVMNLQEIFAKALLVDREALLAAQAKGDVLEANNQLWAAFFTDVRGPLAELRQERGLPGDPFHAYVASGEEEARAASRVGGQAASW